MDNREYLQKLINVASGREPADLVITNCVLVNVYTGTSSLSDIAVCEGHIAGIAESGTYKGRYIFDAHGLYALPGLIESHIHIESSFVTPEEFGRLVVPHGTTTIIADPHEIVNVCGLDGMNYMLSAAEKTALDIKFMLPSCVPATPFEHSGAKFDASDMEAPLSDSRVLGLGEFMNFNGVVSGDNGCLDKIEAALRAGKLVDGHAPGLNGNALNAYCATGIHTDHECSSLDEMKARLERGLYVQLRNGSACHDLANLLKGVTDFNSRRCVLCSDDRQPVTIFEHGHIDGHLRICVKEGIKPEIAVQMATLNAAECYGLSDRGAIAPGLRADIVLVDNLRDFNVSHVWINGSLVAEKGRYLPNVERASIESVQGSVHIAGLSEASFVLPGKSSRVPAIVINPGSIVTERENVVIERTADGDVLLASDDGLARLAVIERHHATSSMAVALIRGYGIRRGAVAVSVSHDSHNIIVAGKSKKEMLFAVRELERLNGGAVTVLDGKVLESLPLPVAGLMSDKSGEYVKECLDRLLTSAVEKLGVNPSIDPVMTLCFMALPVVPSLKLTDMGLFDVEKGEFVDF